MVIPLPHTIDFCRRRYSEARSPHETAQHCIVQCTVPQQCVAQIAQSVAPPIVVSALRQRDDSVSCLQELEE